MIVRPAQLEDAEGIANVHVTSWQTTYTGIIPDEVIKSLVRSTLSYILGALFGRWDIRYATGELSEPELPDPFSPLPLSRNAPRR